MTDEEKFRNKTYALECLADSKSRGEAFLHFQLHTKGILSDSELKDIDAANEMGNSWRRRADMVAFYIDYGMSRGMWRVLTEAVGNNQRIEVRSTRGLDTSSFNGGTPQEVRGRLCEAFQVRVGEGN